MSGSDGRSPTTVFRFVPQPIPTLSGEQPRSVVAFSVYTIRRNECPALSQRRTATAPERRRRLSLQPPNRRCPPARPRTASATATTTTITAAATTGGAAVASPTGPRPQRCSPSTPGPRMSGCCHRNHTDPHSSIRTRGARCASSPNSLRGSTPWPPSARRSRSSVRPVSTRAISTTPRPRSWPGCSPKRASR